MNLPFGKRKWVKLWTDEWLDGTTRYQMSDAQRAFWIDLLAMAGRSRLPGIVCAGRDGERIIGYPLGKFQGLVSESVNVTETLELFDQTQKIRLEVTQETPIRLLAIHIVNWDRYQSDLESQAKRSRNYRDRKKQRHGNFTPSVTPPSRGVTGVEGEGDREVRDKAEAPAAFSCLGFDASFGHPRFQQIWFSEFDKPAEWLTMKMESAIQKCQRERVKVPPQFYDAKRDVEARENAIANGKYRRTSL